MWRGEWRRIQCFIIYDYWIMKFLKWFWIILLWIILLLWIIAVLYFQYSEIVEQINLPANTQEMNNSKQYFIADKVLNNWITMPSLWLWTWTLSNEEAEKAVYEAIKDGYRLIDTAQYYWNEVWVWNWVRKAIKDWLIKREDVFVTSKIYASSDHAAAIEKSLNNLNIDYIDLLLIHQPWFDDKWLYQTMEKYYKQWKLKSIWISNY